MHSENHYAATAVSIMRGLMKKTLSKEQVEFLNSLTLQYGNTLTKYAYRFYGYRPHMYQTAEDAVQETLIKAINDVDTLMNHPNRIGWLKLCLRNVLLNARREQYRKYEQLQDSVSESPEGRLQIVLDAFDQLEQYPRLEEVQAVAKAILTEGEADTFYDHFLVGLTTEETALLENTTADTVRGRISRIRKKLRKYFRMMCSLIVILFYR